MIFGETFRSRWQTARALFKGSRLRLIKQGSSLMHSFAEQSMTAGLEGRPSKILLVSSAANPQSIAADLERALPSATEILVRHVSAPFSTEDSALSAILVDCRDEQESVIRVLGELDLLNLTYRPFIVLIVRASARDKAWAIAIGADAVLTDLHDGQDILFVLRNADRMREQHERTKKLNGKLDQLKKDVAGFQSMAFTDHLTNLPNRSYLENWFEEAVSRGVDKWHFAIHMLDLNGFKQINDQYGHRAGDDLLKQVSQRVTQLCRRLDIVVRLGGDEIAIVQANVISEADCLPLVRRLSSGFEAPFHIEGVSVGVGAGVGTALFPRDGQTLSDLLHHADLEMYKNKAAGKEPPMSGRDAGRGQTNAVDDELENARFTPVFSMQDGRLAGIISPSTDGTSSTLEDLNSFRLMLLLSSQWRSIPKAPLFSARLPVVDPEDTRVIERLSKLISAGNAAPSQCEIIMDEPQSSPEVDVLCQLRAWGFGIGIAIRASTFCPQRLLNLPLTRVHLDPDFLGHGSDNGPSRVMIDLAVVFARAAYAATVSHGVSSADHIDVLRQAGVDQACGPFLGDPTFGRDLSPTRLQALLTRV